MELSNRRIIECSKGGVCGVFESSSRRMVDLGVIKSSNRRMMGW